MLIADAGEESGNVDKGNGSGGKKDEERSSCNGERNNGDALRQR